MKISSKCIYAISIMIEIAKYYNKPVKRKKILESFSISDSYLENILIALNKVGLIEAFRGPYGGYMLTKKPSEYTFYQLVEMFHLEQNRGTPIVRDGCSVVWDTLQNIEYDILQGVTIQDMVHEKINN